MLSHLDTLEHALDRVCDWLTAHPRITCALIVAVCLIPMIMETPR